MNNPKRHPLVRKLGNFFQLDATDEQILRELGSTIVSYGPDQDIIREGDQPTHSSLLLEGFVFRYKIIADGKRQIISFHLPGDIFDAQNFLLPRMDHSIGTLTACRIAMIPHSSLTRLTEENPRLTRAIWKDTLIDAAIFRQWVTNLGCKDAYARIAHLICELFVRMRAVGLTDGNTMEWPITQTEIGDAAGMSYVHVNRTLQELRGKGLITLRNGRLTILDWDGLKEAADFDIGYLFI